MKLKSNKGFTLIEVIVVAAIIAILAGILVPMIFSQIDESKKTRAMGDVKSLQSAVMAFRKDTGKWPNLDFVTCIPGLTLMQGDGTLPTLDATWSSLTPGYFNDHIGSNAATSACYKSQDSGVTPPVVPGWNGTYMPNFTADPWGRAYVMNVKDFTSATDGVWIISAGPDGVVKTTPGDSSAQNLSNDDYDIGVRVK